MSTHHPAARNNCRRSKKAVKKVERDKSAPDKPKEGLGNQPFMATSPDHFFKIGKSMACQKKAIVFARSERGQDEKKGVESPVTVGVVEGGKCVFAEGPHANHFLSQGNLEFRT